MPDVAAILEACRVPPGKRIALKDYDPAAAGDAAVAKDQRKRYAAELLSQDVSALTKAQELLYASDMWAVLLIFQAMDAAGKDSTIKHVMSGVNPQGCQVYSFKQPSAEELDHNFLWRYYRCLPERGRIGIFNRSYYEEVLVVKVHPELLAAEKIGPVEPGAAFWQSRYDDINALEQHLARNGMLILKFFLYVSKEEQRQRFLKRLKTPEKHWKFSAADLEERAFWDDYQQAYEDALNATSTPWAPWYVVPADHKWVSRAIVAKVITTSIDALRLQYPVVTPEKQRQIEEAKKLLKKEKPGR
jgi:PPK2 family polyphosphate:nucleotide phosphotransferase